MSEIALIELVLMTVGSSILVASFIAQITKTYRMKSAVGIKGISWIQNFIGRSLFVVYGIWAPGPAGLVLGVSQGLCAAFSVPMIYYWIRNRQTEGVYVKAEFRRWLFAGRVTLVAMELGLILFSIFAHDIVHVVHIAPIGDVWRTVISLLCSTIASTAFVPQTLKIMRTKVTKSLSLGLTCLFVLGNALLVASLIVTLVDKHDLTYIAIIVMALISVGAMAINLGIKVHNRINNGEK